MPLVVFEAELTQTIVVAKAWDDAVRDCKTLRELLRPMHAWTQNTTTQAEVKVFILDNLWGALPRPPFTVEETEAVANRVYDFVWQQSASGHDLAAA